MFSAGMTVQCRGQKCIVVDASPLVSGDQEAYRIRVRAIEGPLRNQEWPVISTLEPVTPEEIPPLSLEQIGRDARFRLLHEAFRLTLAPPATALFPLAVHVFALRCTSRFPPCGCFRSRVRES